MSKGVEFLDQTANHFEHQDWNYTRQTSIKDIKYTKEYDKKNTIFYRLKSAYRWMFEDKSFLTQLEYSKWGQLRMRIIMPFYVLKRDKNIPDGSLDRGNVITFWEETGEYLQLVQPSVGSLLADFLKEEPENPHAKLIAAELDRIVERYQERIDAGEVN